MGFADFVPRTNEYVHFAEGQMFLATYAGMSIRKKNLSTHPTLCIVRVFFSATHITTTKNNYTSTSQH